MMGMILNTLEVDQDIINKDGNKSTIKGLNKWFMRFIKAAVHLSVQRE